MDPSMDSDYVMSGGLGDQVHQRGQKGQKTCFNCNQTGHIAKFCPSGQNNSGGNNNGPRNQNGGNNGGRNNAQQGRKGKTNGGNNNAQNGRGNNNNNNNAQQHQNGRGGKKNKVDPESTSPDELCYMHGGHRNDECTNRGNIWSPNRDGNGNGNNKKNKKNGNQNQGQSQNQQQQQNRPQQENRHGNKRANSGPIPGAGYDYCERCNSVGHTTVYCTTSGPGTRLVLKCSLCENHGHTRTECRHPALCARCRKYGHSEENCNAKTLPAEVLLNPRPAGFVPSVDAASVNVEPCRAAQPTYPQMPIPQANSGITKAYFANARGELVLEAPMDEVTQQICAIAAENEAARRQAIATKCCNAHMMYSLQLLNDQIEAGARFFGRVDPSNPQIQLPPNVHKTDALERLCQFWINDNSFGMAAAFVRKGWNFFRDPRTLDAIARSSTPVCHCCSSKGRILSATFTQLMPGTDVLSVEDYDLWGPSVMFSCKCSLNGYSFFQSGDSMEVCWT